MARRREATLEASPAIAVRRRSDRRPDRHGERHPPPRVAAEHRAITFGGLGAAAWRAAASMRAALAIMLALGLLGLLGAVIQQVPAGTSEGSDRAAWLASAERTYGTWTRVLDGLGLFDVFNSPWFRAALGALVASILACSIHRFRTIWRYAFRPPLAVAPAYFAAAACAIEFRPAMVAGDAAIAVRQRLARHGYRTVVTEKGHVVHVFADRFRFAPFGSLVAHLSLLTILVGALLGSLWGFRNPALVVPVGSRVDVGFDTGYSVEAVGFTDSYYVNGSPSDYATDLVLYENGLRVASQRVRVNEPLRYGDLSVYQSFFGPAVVLTARSQGTVAFGGGVPLVWTSSDGLHSIGRFTIESAGLSIYVGTAASGRVDPALGAGQLEVEVYRLGDETEPLGSAVLTQGVAATIAGVDLTFVRERQYSGLIVARDPGLRFIWAGAALLVVGIFVVFLFRPRRIWARVEASEGGSVVSVAAGPSHDPRLPAQFEALAAEIAAALAPEAAGSDGAEPGEGR